MPGQNESTPSTLPPKTDPHSPTRGERKAAGEMGHSTSHVMGLLPLLWRPMSGAPGGGGPRTLIGFGRSRRGRVDQLFPRKPKTSREARRRGLAQQF
ncbi:MAG: hypothetical protein Q8P67_20320 [archaeon]|nr:hypothetical protein [archaeon]